MRRLKHPWDPTLPYVILASRRELMYVPYLPYLRYSCYSTLVLLRHANLRRDSLGEPASSPSSGFIHRLWLSQDYIATSLIRSFSTEDRNITMLDENLPSKLFNHPWQPFALLIIYSVLPSIFERRRKAQRFHPPLASRLRCSSGILPPPS